MTRAPSIAVLMPTFEHAHVRHHYSRVAAGAIDGYPLQLVQTMHRRGNERWIERGELVTDDLERMFWSKLRANAWRERFALDHHVDRLVGFFRDVIARHERRASRARVA